MSSIFFAVTRSNKFRTWENKETTFFWYFETAFELFCKNFALVLRGCLCKPQADQILNLVTLENGRNENKCTGMRPLIHPFRSLVIQPGLQKTVLGCWKLSQWVPGLFRNRVFSLCSSLSGMIQTNTKTSGIFISMVSKRFVTYFK